MTDEPIASIELAGGAQALIFDQIDSTNEEALRRIRADEAEDGLWIVAKSQTRGRGRRGREWVSEAGNFFASVLVELQVPLAQAPALSFVAALAAGDCISEVIGSGGKVSYKWPNDILVDGHKAAGILIEAESDPETGQNWAVVGIGINTESAPEEVRYPATSLNQHVSYIINNNNLLELLSKAWIAHLYGLNQGGFEALKALWLENAEGLGGEICVKIGDNELRGVFSGLGPAGELRLQMADGYEMKILAGDVTELNV